MPRCEALHIRNLLRALVTYSRDKKATYKVRESAPVTMSGYQVRSLHQRPFSDVPQTQGMWFQ